MAKGKKGVGPLEEEDKKGKQARLPQMEDAAIEDIEEAASIYAEHRDKRIAVFRKELDAKDTLLQVMKRHKKRSYNHGGCEIEIVPEGEKLRVRITSGEK